MESITKTLHTPLVSDEIDGSLAYFKKHLLIVANEEQISSKSIKGFFSQVEIVESIEALTLESVQNARPDAILVYFDTIDANGMAKLRSLRKMVSNLEEYLPIIVVSDHVEVELKKELIRRGVDDCLSKDFVPQELNSWIEFVGYVKRVSKDVSHMEVKQHTQRIPLGKRMFDILVSGLALLMLSPLFLLIAIIIKLESRGPIFYVSPRAGTGYKTFNFLKFRSMRNGADKELSKLSHLNQYGGNVDFNGSKANPVFVKIKDDPRVTRFGNFLRNTSLDELPQLINVLKGDMSIVGNRPLPLYEAETLTKDKAAMRFMAPAGITGLWQVTKRGKGDMSADERIALDIEYAKTYSLKTDLSLIFKTIPALIQEEKV